MDCGGDVTVDEFQPVVAIDGKRLVGKSKPVERSKQPVSGTIACENASRAIAAVRRGRKTHDEQPSVDRTQAGNRASPILLIAKSPDFGFRHFLAVNDKSIAARAVNNLVLCDGRRIAPWSCHVLKSLPS